MGHFVPSGGTPPGIGGKGFFGSPPPKVIASGPTFMVVGANSTNPNTANVPLAAFRNASGVWSVVNTAGFGARGLFGVTHDAQPNFIGWFATSNQPGNIGSKVGNTPDGDPPGAFQAISTGLNQPLTDISHNTQFIIGTLFGNIITAPSNLSSFTSNPANGPGSYVILGVATNGGATSYVCVGQGSAAQGVCQSPDGATWAQQTVSFSTNNDFTITANSVIWDGAQFVAVSGNVVIRSADGQTWTTSAANNANTNCIAFDSVHGKYIVGCTDGNVLVASTVAGLATAVNIPLSLGNVRCAASRLGTTILGDDTGEVFVTTNGATFTTENPGLGANPLTAAAANL